MLPADFEWTEQLLRQSFANETQPRWSPNGKYLLFLTDRMGGYQVADAIFSQSGQPPVGPKTGLDPTVRSPVRLSPPGVPVVSANWSSDGKYLIYQSKDQLYTVPIVFPTTEVEAQIKETELMALDLIDGDDLPDRVHNNLKVMLFGFNQFLRFGQLAGLLDDDQSYHAMLKPALTAVKESVCGSQGVTRLALDDLLDNLAVMAEVGRLQAGTHYQLLELAQVAIRIKSCLAEFRRFHRETQLQGELLDMAAYHKQLRENQERQGYVLETSKAVTFTSGHNQRKRAVIIDLEQALALGLDLSGFEN